MIEPCDWRSRRAVATDGVVVQRVALIGFGEAAQAFAIDWPSNTVAYDRKTDDDATRGTKVAEMTRCGIATAATNATAVAGADLIVSLVTADQALAVAREAACHLPPGALFLDLNSVAPQTKCAADAAIVAAGGRYADVAVLAPVQPARLAVPLLVSGPEAASAAQALAALGFTAVTIAGNAIGDASAVKMIRSVMIKGIEALSAECLLAAERAGVREAVIASLDASWPGADWARRFDYNLDRMMLHGCRRAAEMAEVVATLEDLGTGAILSRGIAVRQHAIGALGLMPPDGLAAKLAAIASKDATP